MSTKSSGLLHFVRHLFRFAGLRAALVVVAMIAVALSEGLGLVLLIPLLALVGVGADEKGGALSRAITEFTAQLEFALTLELVVMLFIALVTVRQAMIYLSTRLVEETRISYVASLRKDLFDALGETDWQVLRGGEYAHHGQILLVDCWRVGDASLNLFRIISASFIILVNLGVAFAVAPTLAAIAVIGIGTMMIVFGGRTGAALARGGRITDANNEVYRVVDNFLDNLRVAKLSTTEPKMQKLFVNTLDDLSSELSDYFRSTVAARVALQLAAAIGLAGFVLVAANGFGVRGTELLIIIFITARLIPHFTALNQSIQHVAHNLPAFSNADSAISECRAHREKPAEDVALDLPRESIALENVTVYAPDDTDKSLLRNVDIDLRIGETVAIGGPSGAGKSTLADVISGLLRPDRGHILIDGQPLTDEQRLAWRRHVGYVPQSSILLRDSLRENLTWLMQDAPAPGALRRVLACTEIETLIAAMPDGIDTQVNQREGKLSGGERQRIALARELLRQPVLLILDEATSALDIDIERCVLENIRNDYPSLTILLVAHRPETLGLADRVVQLNDGKIIDNSGTCAGGAAHMNGSSFREQRHA